MKDPTILEYPATAGEDVEKAEADAGVKEREWGLLHRLAVRHLRMECADLSGFPLMLATTPERDDVGAVYHRQADKQCEQYVDNGSPTMATMAAVTP